MVGILSIYGMVTFLDARRAQPLWRLYADARSGFCEGGAAQARSKRGNYNQEHPTMKKNNLKKLTLSKETLRGLDAEKLADVAGGGDTSIQYSHCGSCGIACTVISCRVDC